MLLVDVLDDRNLKLARQEHDRHHRENRKPGPVRIAASNAFEGCQHRAQFRHGRRAPEQVAETVVDTESDKNADGQKREQLHQRLERDRRHHALVMLGCVEMARAEGNGEGGENQRHP